MKPYKKPEFSPGYKIFAGAILVLLFPILFIAFLYIIGKMFVVYVPALMKIQTVPRYWLTWKHIKLLTGLSTNNTLSLLRNFTDGKFLECRLREEAQLERIRKLRKDTKVPTGDKPFFPDHVIYYEFRMVWRGGRKRPSLRELIGQQLSGLRPRPVLAPAYAS